MSARLTRTCFVVAVAFCDAMASAQDRTADSNPYVSTGIRAQPSFRGKAAAWWQHQLDLYYGRPRGLNNWRPPQPTYAPIPPEAYVLPPGEAAALAVPPPLISVPHHAAPIHLVAQHGASREVPVEQSRDSNGSPRDHTASTNYPRLNAPLYPMPVQNVPFQVGGTMIPNQAFAPHEMMYGHSYRAMYPPFYYRVKGSWLWTPFGIDSHDQWTLMGTEVKVKYRTDYSPFANFAPPLSNPFQLERVRY